MRISAPHDLETLVCARGAKLSLEVVIEAPGISPARKPRINLRPTGDGEACEDPRVAGFGGRSGANVISQAEKFAKLDFICG